MPESVEKLMETYSHYENDFNTDFEFSEDVLQDLAYSENPITPTHLKYYHSKYRKGHYWMMLFFIFSIGLYTIHFAGLYLILNSLGVDVLKNFLPRTIGIIIFLSIFALTAFLLKKIAHKWNWKKLAYFFALVIGIASSILIFINPTIPEINNPTYQEFELYITFFYGLFNLMGIAYGPACLLVSIIYKTHSSITDFGGIHLFLGWIYRISETNGHLKVLNSSFHHLINELDNWLNETSKILIKNKNEILEGFYLNILSKEKFLENICKKYRDSFNNIFKGLLVENILKSKTFSYLSKDVEKKISSLDKVDLKMLNYRLALTQIPKIINIIEILSTKKLEVIFYSFSEKLKKIKSKMVTFILFMFTTLIPLIISFFV